MYKFLLDICAVIFKLFNGSPKVYGLENIDSASDPAIFAVTHRSATDPFYLAITVRPKVVSFMAKESLFKYKSIAWILRRVHVFPVNREKPSTKVIKHAVKLLKDGQKYLGIFPTGSRYSTEIKGGTALIQKMAKVDIIPVAIQPPKNAKEFFMRKSAGIAFGQPIPYQADLKYSKEDLQRIDQTIGESFKRLDRLIDTNYIKDIHKH